MQLTITLNGFALLVFLQSKVENDWELDWQPQILVSSQLHLTSRPKLPIK